METLEIPESTSASQLTTYSLCPRKYAFSYVYGVEPEFVSTSLVLGSAVHSAVAWWHGERLHGHTPTFAQAKTVFTADLLSETAASRVRWKTATPESLEAEGLALLEMYLFRYGELPVAQVEAPFLIDLEDPVTGEPVGRPL